MIVEMFHQYRQVEEYDETKEQTDTSILGSHFISFLSTMMTCRLVDHQDTVSVLEKSSTGNSAGRAKF